MIFIANDMLLFKKRIALSRFHNIVVLIPLKSSSSQSTLHGTFRKLQEAKERLDELAVQLVLKHAARAYPDLVNSVQKVINCCKMLCTSDNA